MLLQPTGIIFTFTISMKLLGTFLCVTSVAFCCFSQTGPAGVGTSANNVFWLKADVGPSSTVNATPISYWNDQSGNGINVSQTVTAQQPSFATNVINGFPAIQFDNVNGAGLNDKMLGPDSPILDNTSGYTFFTVSRPQNFGDAHVIVSKRTTVSVDQSFMLFYYTSNKFHVDIQTTNDRYASNTVYSVNNNYLIDVVYDGTLPAASRSKTYNEQSLDITSSETSTLVPDNASPIIIGTTDASDPRPYGGYMSEVIIYRQALTDAPKIIVDNYLSAKYNIALSANDKYAGDNPANGNYDREVAGIGKENTGSNPSFSASISGGLTISSNSGLNNSDYALAGHASLANYQTTVDVGGMTGLANARWLRIWYIDVTNTGQNINADIEFDMSDGGVGNPALSIASNYVLLYRPGQSGNWTETATGSSIVGDRVIFSGYTLVDDGYYTIGTKNYLVSPLPITLLNFDAIKNDNKVDISWSTASEQNNDHFTVQRSKDAITFEDVTTIKGATNSSSIINYNETDYNPYNGLSYYRLKQTDLNGSVKYFNMVPVNYGFEQSKGINIFPNPSSGNININLSGLENQEAVIVVRDITGKEYFSKVLLSVTDNQVYAADLEGRLIPGTYIVIASSNNKVYSQKIIIK